MRKFFLILLSTLMVFSLTGCKQIDKLIANKQEADQMKLVESAASMPKSSYSKSLEAEYRNANKDYHDRQQAYDEKTWFGKLLTNISGDNPNKYKAKAEHAKDSYTEALSTDSVYQTALKEQNSKNGFKLDTKTVLIIVAIVVVLIILACILLGKKSKKPKKDFVTPTAAKVAAPDLHPAKHAKEMRVRNYKVNYEKLLHENCDQLKLDYDQTLSQYGGDARKAYESTNYMIQKDRFG